MKVNNDKFYQGNYGFKRCANGAAEFAPMYSYESAAKLYDIAVIDGQKYYRVNGGAWARTIDRITPTHVEIESHFSI